MLLEPRSLHTTSRLHSPAGYVYHCVSLPSVIELRPLARWSSVILRVALRTSHPL